MQHAKFGVLYNVDRQVCDSSMDVMVKDFLPSANLGDCSTTLSEVPHINDYGAVAGLPGLFAGI